MAPEPGIAALTGPVLRERGPAAAGELLLERIEALARSQPRRAVELAERWLDESVDDPVLAAWRDRACGTAFHLAGDTRRAAPLLRRAMEAIARSGDREAADRTGILLVDVLGELQEIAGARRLARRLVRRFEERGDRARAAATLANLACAEDAVDRVARAEAFWREARRRLPEEDLRRLLVEANLANVLMLWGRLEDAIRAHREIEGRARSLGLDGLVLQARLNRAEAEFAAGRPGEAFAMWHAVIRDAEQVGAHGLAVAAALDLAMAEAESGNLEEAGRRAGELLPRLEALGLERERLKAVRLVALAAAGAGRSDEWRALHEQLDERGLGTARDLLLLEAAGFDAEVDPAAVERAARRLRRQGLRVRGIVGLAWASWRAFERGDTARGERLAREVLGSRVRAPWARLVALRTLAGTDQERRIVHLKRAVREARRLHGRLRAAADRAAFLQTRGAVYGDLVEALIGRNRPQDRREALDLLAELRDAWLVEELSSQVAGPADRLVARWQRLRRKLAVLLGELEGEDEGRMRASGLQLEAEVDAVERELVRTEVELLRIHPSFPGLEARRTVARDLATLLPAGHVFAEYFVGRHDLTIFVIRDGRLVVHRVPGGAWELAELVASIRFHLDSRPLVDARWRGRMRRTLEERLAALGSLLLPPLGTAGPWDVLWVAPHDGLYHVPWNALPLPDGQRLGDAGNVALVPGAAACCEILGRPPRAPRSSAVLGAGTGALEWVEQEIGALSGTIPGAVIRERATREDLLAALSEAELVHLAGHALFLDGLPRASGLRLADGFVTVHDLAAARIASRVVSFGVCSGLRLGEDGAQFGGFLQVLLMRGVGTVVGPITAVEDEIAYTFDVEWVDGLVRHGDPGRAYADAVGRVREREPDPAVWASFQLYGDPRPWRDER